MRHLLAVLAVSATCSMALASNFAAPSNNQSVSLPNVQADDKTPDSVGTAAIPAPATAVVAVAGLAAMGRRRREK